MRSSENKPVAIVTGASRGLGKVVALRLAREGYDLSLAARSEKPLRQLQQDLVDRGVSVLVSIVDLADSADRERLVRSTLEKLGRIDVLVNYAAMSSVSGYANSEWKEVNCQVDLNLLTPMHLTHMTLPHMIEAGSGKIVNVLSPGSAMSLPGHTTYASTKAGLRQFTSSLGRELVGTGVTASVVIPGEDASSGDLNPTEIAADVLSALQIRQSESLVA